MWRFAGCGRLALRCPSGAVLHAAVAERWRLRLTGLAALPSLAPGRALLIPRCRSVHTIGMRFPIDVAFVLLSPEGAAFEVLALHQSLPPYRVARSRRGARSQAALELPAGAASLTGLRADARIEVLGATGA